MSNIGGVGNGRRETARRSNILLANIAPLSGIVVVLRYPSVHYVGGSWMKSGTYFVVVHKVRSVFLSATQFSNGRRVRTARRC